MPTLAVLMTPGMRGVTRLLLMVTLPHAQVLGLRSQGPQDLQDLQGPVSQ